MTEPTEEAILDLLRTDRDFVLSNFRVLHRVLHNLDSTEFAKLSVAAPEGYKYEVRLVRKVEDELPMPGYSRIFGHNPTVESNPPELTTREVCDLLEANPVPASPFFSDCGSCGPAHDPVEPLVPPPIIPYDPALKYEHKGLTCYSHGLQAHRRERNAVGPWTCVACAPAPADPQ